VARRLDERLHLDHATITENDIKVSKFLNPANAVVLDVNILARRR
jgi:hypothetical protein